MEGSGCCRQGGQHVTQPWPLGARGAPEAYAVGEQRVAQGGGELAQVRVGRHGLDRLERDLQLRAQHACTSVALPFSRTRPCCTSPAAVQVSMVPALWPPGTLALVGTRAIAVCVRDCIRFVVGAGALGRTHQQQRLARHLGVKARGLAVHQGQQPRHLRGVVVAVAVVVMVPTVSSSMGGTSRMGPTSTRPSAADEHAPCGCRAAAVPAPSSKSQRVQAAVQGSDQQQGRQLMARRALSPRAPGPHPPQTLQTPPPPTSLLRLRLPPRPRPAPPTPPVCQPLTPSCR
jgi:hypothetical protein